MKTFDPAGFSQFDIVNDDIYPPDLPPGAKRKLQDLNLARSKNNALFALSWKPESRTSARVDAHHHSVCSSRPMSSFNLNKMVTVLGPLYRSVADLTKIVYRNRRMKDLSRLETLPAVLLRKINDLLDKVDEVCLSLTSKALGASIGQFRTQRCLVFRLHTASRG
jgi:hypothetical protein